MFPMPNLLYKINCFVTVHGKLKSEIRASFKPDLSFADVAYRLVSILRHGNRYGKRSHKNNLTFWHFIFRSFSADIKEQKT
ncbi:MAG: hypothetical protein B1H11_01575 [Desulfobacteraceae bacterium 4484_190.1]|nr:MAG: hypothetical protein B1H11_01575 [Desulfobacteraceae bacterium 4484_190.1]